MLGGLKVYVKPESQVFGELPAAWVTFGDQGNHWFRGNISIPHFSERFQIIIEGIRGTSYIGDSAIDDVSVRTVDCDNVGNSTDNDTSVIMADSCRGRCRESDNSSSCGCNDDCVWSSTCCDDFSSICTKGEGDESKEEIPIPVDRPMFGTTIRLETETVDLISSETSTQGSTDSISILPTLQSTSVSSPISTSSNPKESEISVDITVNVTVPSSEVKSSNPTTKISDATSSMSTTSTTISSTSSTSSSSSSSTTTTPATTTTSTTTTTTTTTTPIPTTSTSTTPPPTASTISPTTTSTTSSTTTTSTTSPTTTTSATVKSTLPITSSSVSILSSSTSTLSSKPVVVPIEVSSTLPRVTTPTTPATTTTPEPQMESTQSTRRIYNLRPRVRTTPITTSSTRSISALTTQAYQSTSTQQSSRVFSPTIHTSTKIHVTTSRSVFRWPTTPTPARVLTDPPPIYVDLRKNFTSKPIVKPSEISVLDTEAHAAKASSDNGQPVITIISVIIVIIICIAAGLVFFMRRLKAKKLSKLEDDSEMKFLSENEVVEYSDSSALDRINFNPQ
ncbi:uncharacterized protein TNIN_490621 [Trichonephila inaurata madagascariensis]|uniref:Uncharacterized protein n=1 Tax=Trichonephila inaurata madagascariensis TaxID=2747483 RepID=A0A8X6X2N2_9ARAC|nr:uncharacterized protein TNIN_490621 [Trichonephila inaurata madagascariensis]